MILDSFLSFDSKYFLEIGNFVITWYAVCILTGVVLAAILGVKEAKRFGIASNLIIDGVLICVPLAIIGARLYYVFSSWNSFCKKDADGKFLLGDTLLSIIGFSNGSLQLAGLAINGGIIVAIIFVIVYCYKRKMKTLAVFDLLAPGLLIGQICGRWGNFFNQEAHGPEISAKTLNWLQYIIPSFILDGMTYADPSIGGGVKTWHPTFLYESLLNTIALVIILVSRRINKKQRLGDSICFYMTWYGLMRALVIEPLRTDPLLFSQAVGPDVLFNRVNIVLNLVLALIGIIWFILKHTVVKSELYLEYQADIKSKKIDGVVCKLEGTLVLDDRLVKNAYYYTAKEILNKDLSEEVLDTLIKIRPEEYFGDNIECINYYNDYYKRNLGQLVPTQNCREFFKTLFVHDYNVAIVSNEDNEFVEYVLNALHIRPYVSVIIDKDYTSGNLIEDGIKTMPNAKNILVICDKKEEVQTAHNLNAKSCLVYYSDEKDSAMEDDPEYVIYKFAELDNVIIE